MPPLKRGTIVYIKSPASGRGTVEGLMTDLTSYLVLLKREDFSKSGWVEVLKSMQPKNAGVGSRFPPSETNSDKSVYKVYQEVELSSAKIIEDAPPATEEMMIPDVMIGTLLDSNRQKPKHYEIIALDDVKGVKIRDIDNKESYWWTSLESIRRNFHAVQE